MQRSVSLTDLVTYGAFLVAVVLLYLDWLGEPDAWLRGAAVVLVVVAHHVWMRANIRRHVDEAISASVVEQTLRSMGGEVHRLNR